MVLLLLVVGGAPSARAQTVPGMALAKQVFEEGVALEKKGDFAGAAAKFDEAAKIAGAPGVRFHQGYAYEMLGKLATALDHYESALALARDQNKPELEKATIARLEPLRARVPQLAIRLATKADAKVKLDDKEVAPLLFDGKPFRVDPGDHAVTATAAGYRDFSRRVQLREGVASSVDLVLEKATGPAPATPAPAPTPASTLGPALTPPKEDPTSPVAAPPHEGRRRSLGAPIAATAAASVFAIGGIVGFLLAGSAHSDAQSECPSKLSCDDERSKVRTLDTVALTGFVGAAALGVVAVVLWTSGRSPRSLQDAPAPSARLYLGPGSAGIHGALW